MSRAMIRVSPPMVKQAPERSSSPGRRNLTLLPPAGGPEIVRSRGGEVDALLVVMPESAGPASLEELPESLRWRDLLARERPSAGAVRSTSLANRRQTRDDRGRGPRPADDRSCDGRLPGGRGRTDGC